jgi:tetratricopeptide (TPR) repeat protein
MDDSQVAREADNQRIALLREVTRGAPRFADAWAELALAEASAAEVSSTAAVGEDAETAVTLRASARGNLQRARALDPRLGSAFVAEVVLTPRGDWNARLGLLRNGLRVSPDEPRLHGLLSLTSRAIGRNGDSLRSARREVELDPLSRAARNRLVSALAYSGEVAEAHKELDSAELIWPGSPALADARFRLELRQGDPGYAIKVLRTTADVHPLQHLEAFLNARSHRNPGNVALVRRMILKRYYYDPSNLRLDVQSLVQLGLIDDAFALASREEALAPMRHATDVLFRSYMKPMWLDRRFIGLAARLGLVRQWAQSGLYPDFCLDPDLPYDCRAEGNIHIQQSAT